MNTHQKTIRVYEGDEALEEARRVAEAAGVKAGAKSHRRASGPSHVGNAGGEGGTLGSGLPRIQGNKRQLRDMTADALRALRARNNPPQIFQRGGLLIRLRRQEDTGAPYLERLNDSALRGVLARVADWFNSKEQKDGSVINEDDAPPSDVVRDLANLSEWEGIPPLDAVVESPVYTRHGHLVVTPGYHSGGRLWYSPAAGLTIPPVPERPSRQDVKRARDLLLTELLGDFPFHDDASKAHALAALLLPFVRQLIDGPTPLHLIDAPVEGTGKGLLVSCVTTVATGREAEPIAEAGSDEEWRKRITAVLAGAPNFVLLDNLNHTLDAGALAAALTTRRWKDRILVKVRLRSCTSA